MPPLPKTCPKTVCPRTGVAFLWKAFLQKNFQVREKIFIELMARGRLVGIVTVRSLPAMSVVGAKAENIGLLARNALISRNSALLREQNYGSAVPGASLPPAGSRNSGGPLSILLGFLIRPVSKAHLDHDGRRTASPQPRAPA